MNKSQVLVLMAIELNKALLLARYIYIKKKLRNKRIVVRKLLKERREKGYFHALVPEITVTVCV